MQGRQNYKLEVLVDDVKEAVQALGHDQCVLVGHDWGGALAWTFAYAHPSLVSRLVTMCGPHPAAFTDNLDWDQFKRWVSLVQLQQACRQGCGPQTLGRLRRVSANVVLAGSQSKT